MVDEINGQEGDGDGKHEPGPDHFPRQAVAKNDHHTEQEACQGRDKRPPILSEINCKPNQEWDGNGSEERCRDPGFLVTGMSGPKHACQSQENKNGKKPAPEAQPGDQIPDEKDQRQASESQHPELRRKLSHVALLLGQGQTGCQDQEDPPENIIVSVSHRPLLSLFAYFLQFELYGFTNKTAPSGRRVFTCPSG